MTQPTDPATPSAIGFAVRAEDLVLLVKIGDQVFEGQLEPVDALTLARDLLAAGIECAKERAAVKFVVDEMKKSGLPVSVN